MGHIVRQKLSLCEHLGLEKKTLKIWLFIFNYHASLFDLLKKLVFKPFCSQAFVKLEFTSNLFKVYRQTDGRRTTSDKKRAGVNI